MSPVDSRRARAGGSAERPGHTRAGSGGGRGRGMWLVAALPLVAGCGFAQRTAINTTIPIIENAMEAAYRNGDVELMEQALPANMILVEGLIETRPDDRRLLALACRMYVSYSLGFVEDRNSERAAGLYETALSYGLRAYPELAPADHAGPAGEAAYARVLEGYDAGDVADLVWVAAAWANMIKGNLAEPSALAELPRLEQLAERLVLVDGDHLYGLPHVLLGSILTFRPAYLGGDPERAREEFDRAFRAAEGRFLLTHLFYARYYCRQVFDEELFVETLNTLLNADPNALPDMLLLNRIAQAQGRRLLDRKEELF